MQFITDMMAYWNGTQAKYDPLNFQCDPNYTAYFDDEQLGLLNTTDITDENITARFKAQRGILLHNDKLYNVNTKKSKPFTIIAENPGNQATINDLKAILKAKPDNRYVIADAKAIQLYTALTDYTPREDNGVHSARTLYDVLHLEFSAAITKLEQEGLTNMPMYEKASQIRVEIEKIAKKQFKDSDRLTYVAAELEQLNQALKRCTIAITGPVKGKEAEYDANAAQLALLAKELPGNAGMGWTILAGLLAMLAVSAITFGIIISCGTLIPAGVLAAMGMSMIISGLTAAAAPVAMAIGHGVTASAAAGTMGIGGGVIAGGTTLATGFYKNKLLAKATDELAKEITKPPTPQVK